MKSFWTTILRAFNKYLQGSLILYIIVMAFLTFVYRFLGTPNEIKDPATVYSLAILGLYGFSRVWRSHPVFNMPYFSLLSLSPWQPGKELLRGPVHLFWVDAVIVAFFMLLTVAFPVYDIWMLPVAFLIGYNAGLLTSFCFTMQESYITFYALFTPFAICPHLNPIIALAVVIVLTAVGSWGIRSYFREFPWNTPWWNADQVKELKKKAIQQRFIQWPFGDLSVTKENNMGIGAGILAAVLVCWWSYAIDWVMVQSGEESLYMLLLMPIMLAIFLRVFSYTVKYRPPLSLWGRICTGRLIIPGYDKIFIAPIIMEIAVLGTIYIGGQLDISLRTSMFFATGIAIFLSLALPPSLEEWHYTGHHRIAKFPVKPMPTTRNKPNPSYNLTFLKKQK